MSMKLCLTALLLLIPATVRAEDPPSWVAPMKKVHAQFKGKPGTLLSIGDSITVSKAFWSPFLFPPEKLPDAIARDLQTVKPYMLEDCWMKWKGPEFGNESAKTCQWAVENLDGWLKKLNPEVAVLMLGTNDVVMIDAATYDARLRATINPCLKNGTIVILTTIPPRAGAEKKSKEFADVERKIAADVKLPLIDYQAEILKRRPDDWNGSLPKFRAAAEKDVYAVPTLIAADGVHPSNPSNFVDYSAEALNTNGYQLRNVMTLKAYAEVIRLVLAPEKK